MIIDQYGQFVYEDKDLADTLTAFPYYQNMGPFLVRMPEDKIDRTNKLLGYTALIPYVEMDIGVEEFDRRNQQEWWMPEKYQNMDIVKYILELCQTEPELQRCAQEILLYQKHGLIDLLRYLKYLVDIMNTHDIIWGVGRGSSVASYVLYKLGVHRVDSMYYQLDITEFFRDSNDA